MDMDRLGLLKACPGVPEQVGQTLKEVTLLNFILNEDSLFRLPHC